jgi:hypothetical protein
MSDIVERLRSADVLIVKSATDLRSVVAEEAADEIEKLRAALRGVLAYYIRANTSRSKTQKSSVSHTNRASLRGAGRKAMSDIADKIYAATGLTLNAEAAAAIGKMIQQARRDALEEAASLVDDVHQWDGKDEYCESCKGGALYPDARDVAATIRALGEKE